MRVVLQAETGGRAGHKIWLGANQRVFVGGTEWAEFVVPGDPDLADVQFVVESDHHFCRIRNLQTARSLFVNGVEVVERTLVNGDIVAAGATRFSILVQESPTIAAKQAAIDRKKRLPAVPVLSYRVDQCPSGLLTFSGTNSTTPAVDLARTLAQNHAFHLLLHVNRSEVPLPVALEQATDLFARGELPVAECVTHSPIILSASDPVDRFELLRQSWTKDAVVGIFATVERDALLRNLQRTTVWLTPPSVVRGHLTKGDAADVEELMLGIKAVLLESRLTEEWTVFTRAETAPLWSQLGFPNAPQPVPDGGTVTGPMRRRKSTAFRRHSA